MACTIAVAHRGQQRGLVRTFQVLRVAVAFERGPDAAAGSQVRLVSEGHQVRAGQRVDDAVGAGRGQVMGGSGQCRGRPDPDHGGQVVGGRGEQVDGLADIPPSGTAGYDSTAHSGEGRVRDGCRRVVPIDENFFPLCGIQDADIGDGHLGILRYEFEDVRSVRSSQILKPLALMTSAVPHLLAAGVIRAARGTPDTMSDSPVTRLNGRPQPRPPLREVRHGSPSATRLVGRRRYGPSTRPGGPRPAVARARGTAVCPLPPLVPSSSCGLRRSRWNRGRPTPRRPVPAIHRVIVLQGTRRQAAPDTSQLCVG